MKLYEHQEKFIHDIRQSMRGNKSIVAQAATGFGKTACAADIVKSALAKNTRVFFTVHRRELITQTAAAFQAAGVQHGYIAAGYPSDISQCYIVSIDTAKNRIDTMPTPGLVLVDEAHLGMSKGWSRLIEHWQAQGAWTILLTATPWRLDGSGLGEVATDMVCGPSVSWLIERSYLSRYKLFAPSVPDLKNVIIRAGDFAAKQAAHAMDKSSITGDAISHFSKLAGTRRALAFCVSVRHAEHVAEQFSAAGIPAEHIEGRTPAAERRRIINDFADGRIRVLTNCEITTTGFDLSAQVGREVTVDTIILLRPTKSLSLYLQMVGRGLRRKNYKAVILDHAGNALRHGLPCHEREWTLDGREKKKGSTDIELPIKQCPECYAVFTPGPEECPECGAELEPRGRKVDEVAGVLEEVDLTDLGTNPARKRAQTEQGLARTIEDLIALGKRRGYKPGWAYHVYRSRNNKKNGSERNTHNQPHQAGGKQLEMQAF